MQVLRKRSVGGHQRRTYTPHAPIERLPPELLTLIFFSCLEVNLPRASPAIARVLSTETIYTWLIRLAFATNTPAARALLIDDDGSGDRRRHAESGGGVGGGKSVDESAVIDSSFSPFPFPSAASSSPTFTFFPRHHIHLDPGFLSPTERARLQTALLSCRWFRPSLIRQCQRDYIRLVLHRLAGRLVLAKEDRELFLGRRKGREKDKDRNDGGCTDDDDGEDDGDVLDAYFARIDRLSAPPAGRRGHGDLVIRAITPPLPSLPSIARAGTGGATASVGPETEFGGLGYGPPMVVTVPGPAPTNQGQSQLGGTAAAGTDPEAGPGGAENYGGGGNATPDFGGAAPALGPGPGIVSSSTPSATSPSYATPLSGDPALGGIPPGTPVKVAIWFGVGAVQVRQPSPVLVEEADVVFQLPADCEGTSTSSRSSSRSRPTSGGSSSTSPASSTAPQTTTSTNTSISIPVCARMPDRLLDPPWTPAQLELLTIFAPIAYIDDEPSRAARSATVLRATIIGPHRDFGVFRLLVRLRVRARAYRYTCAWPVKPNHFRQAARAALAESKGKEMASNTGRRVEAAGKPLVLMQGQKRGLGQGSGPPAQAQAEPQTAQAAQTETDLGPPTMPRNDSSTFRGFGSGSTNTDANDPFLHLLFTERLNEAPTEDPAIRTLMAQYGISVARPLAV